MTEVIRISCAKLPIRRLHFMLKAIGKRVLMRRVSALSVRADVQLTAKMLQHFWRVIWQNAAFVSFRGLHAALIQQLIGRQLREKEERLLFWELELIRFIQKKTQN